MEQFGNRYKEEPQNTEKKEEEIEAPLRFRFREETCFGSFAFFLRIMRFNSLISIVMSS